LYTESNMAKQKKKRNKSYQGAGASTTRPSITKISAVKRNPIHQWWFERKRIVKPVLIAVAVALLVIWLIYELFRAVTGGIG